MDHNNNMQHEDECNTEYAKNLNNAIIERLLEDGPGWVRGPISTYGNQFLPIHESENEIVVSIQEISRTLTLQKSVSKDDDRTSLITSDGTHIYKKESKSLVAYIAQWVEDAIIEEENED